MARKKRSWFKDIIGLAGFLTALYFILNPDLAIQILHDNPALFYWILTPWIVASITQWFVLTGFKRMKKVIA